MSAMEEGCRENPAVFSTSDRVILRRMIDNPKPGQEKVKQQGMMVGFWKWDFDPLELENPFPENDGNPFKFRKVVKTGLSHVKYNVLLQKNHLLYKNAQNCTRAIM